MQTDRAARIDALKDEIRLLSDEQNTATENAVYLPMTSAQIQASDDRRAKIARLGKELEALFREVGL